MFLRNTKRRKDGKVHYYWSLVENRRCGGGRVIQHTVLYLGGINDSQKAQWIRAIEVFDEDEGGSEQMKLFAAELPLPDSTPDGVLEEMRKSDPPVNYLVGTPKGRLSKLEAELAERPSEAVREGVSVKLLPQDGELYVFARSRERAHKERSMRQRQLKALWKRLHQLHEMELCNRDLLLTLGEARGKYRAAWRLIDIELPEGKGREKQQAGFPFGLNRKKLREIRRREGRYVLRSPAPAHAHQLKVFTRSLRS